MVKTKRPRKIRRRKPKANNVAKVIIIAAVLFLCGLIIGNFITPQTVILDNYNQTPIIITRYVYTGENVSSATISVPAVDSDGNGLVTELDVQIIPGSGKILTNIDKLLFWVDTQNSIRTARQVAQDTTGIDLSRYDIIYTIRADASVIEGESAGAALTIATISAIKKTQVRNDVIITGTVNNDGTIGPVGGILEKAQAAELYGASVFLVPLTQSDQVIFETKQNCELIGYAEFCQIEKLPKRVNISDYANITVVEVFDIDGALKYFSNN